MTASPVRFATLLFACLVALSCADSGPGSSLDAAPTAREASQGFTDFGNYVVHYNALPTQQLTPADATSYGITRSKNRALLNIVVQRKKAGSPNEPISGSVTAKTSNLTGQLKNMTLRKITEAQAIYYIGEVSVTNGETLNFDITVVPEGSDEPLNVKFQQQFFTN